MKKKMSILGALVLAVVVTAASVSGTYAKYTDSTEVTDSARVAKFEVTSKNATFTAFNTQANGADIVAPGYSNLVALTVDDLLTVDAEVPTTMNFSIVEDGANASKTLTHGSYDPMRYALVEVAADGTVPTTTTDIAADEWKTWADFKTEVNDLTIDSTKTYVIAWKWAQGETGITDEQDTALGNAIATALKDTTANATTIEELTVRLTLGVTVEQDTTKLNQAA